MDSVFFAEFLGIIKPFCHEVIWQDNGRGNYWARQAAPSGFV